MTNKRMPAPTVIAKGAGMIGRRIRDAAGQHNVATVEKPSLAQAVYRGVAVNRPIPAEHYTAVAEVLTEVYQRDADPCPICREAGSAGQVQPYGLHGAEGVRGS